MPARLTSSLGRAQIDAEARLRGDHVDRTRRSLDHADCRDDAPRVRRGLVLDGRIIAAAAGERVLASPHRHRAGMAGLALDRDVEAAHAGDGGDDAERQVLGLEHRPLLDMAFEIAADLAWDRARSRQMAPGSQPKSRSASASEMPFASCAVEALELEGAGERTRARKRRRKTHALLIAESDDLEREGKLDTKPPQLLHHLDR